MAAVVATMALSWRKKIVRAGLGLAGCAARRAAAVRVYDGSDGRARAAAAPAAGAADGAMASCRARRLRMQVL